MSLLSKMNDINELRNQAKQMQDMLSQEKVEIENDYLKLVMNGKQDILEFSLKDNFESDKQKLESAIKDAFTQAGKKIQKIMASKMQGMM